MRTRRLTVRKYYHVGSDIYHFPTGSRRVEVKMTIEMVKNFIFKIKIDTKQQTLHSTKRAMDPTTPTRQERQPVKTR